MSRRSPSAVAHLPPPLVAELHEHLVDHDFSDYAGTAAWITERGYSLSKSALHRYAVQNAGLIREDVARRREHRITPEVRVRCLEVAVRVAPKGKFEGTAERLLRWVQGTPFDVSNPRN